MSALVKLVVGLKMRVTSDLEKAKSSTIERRHLSRGLRKTSLKPFIMGFWRHCMKDSIIKLQLLRKVISDKNDIKLPK